MLARILTSLIAFVRSFSVREVRLTFFKAYSFKFSFLFTWYTLEYAPDPSFFNIIKLSIDVLGFGASLSEGSVLSLI
jgi:hypothetical protein